MTFCFIFSYRVVFVLLALHGQKKCRSFFCLSLSVCVCKIWVSQFGYIANSFFVFLYLFCLMLTVANGPQGSDRPHTKGILHTTTKHTHTHDPSIHQCDERYSFPSSSYSKKNRKQKQGTEFHVMYFTVAPPSLRVHPWARMFDLFVCDRSVVKEGQSQQTRESFSFYNSSQRLVNFNSFSQFSWEDNQRRRQFLLTLGSLGFLGDETLSPFVCVCPQRDDVYQEDSTSFWRFTVD